MPFYTYHCENCGHEFDRRQDFSEDSLKKCPNCSKLQLRKVYTPARVVFKGSGFYATDNKSSLRGKSSGSNGSSEKGDKKTDKKEKTAETTKSEEKSTPKKEVKSKESANKSD
ncbi:MAG: zinc ribbon domain-containing protein [Chloroflexota bacterium]